METHLERDFGAVMGSILRQTIRVETDPGVMLEESLLPPAGSAVNDWLEVRGTTWSMEQQEDHTLHRIHIDYQVFKGVRQAENLTIPQVNLSLKRDGETVAAEVPPLPFTLNPLIPPGTADEEVIIRPLQPPPALPPSGHGTRVTLWLAGLAGLLGYAAWHLGLPPFGRSDAHPFASAARELRRLRHAPPSVETSRYALRLFHGALNRYAGRTVLESHLPGLFAEHPELAEAREELEALFALSHRLFFVPEKGDDADFPLLRLEKLCRQCRRLEGRRA